MCFKVEDTCVTILNIFRNKDYSFWVTALILKIWWFKSNVLRIIIKIWIPKLQESLYIQSSRINVKWWNYLLFNV